jgi:hydroxylysine kinase
MSNADLLVQFDGGGDDAIARVTSDEVDQILLKHWSVRGKTRSLVAERDEILEVISDDGAHLILKIYSSAEALDIADLRARATYHISERAPELPVPQMIKTEGQLQALATMADGSRRVAQLMTFLPGIPQVDAPRTKKQAIEIGKVLAKTALALLDFRHLAERRNLIWDLANARKVQALLPGDTSGRWQMPARIFERFEDHTSIRLASLPSQVIHNDFNGHNLLMDASDPTRVTGIIDFGDVTRSQRVNDLAIAACYQLRFEEAGLSGALDLVRGYNSVLPLSEEEIGLIFDLVLARLAIAVTITEFRAVRLPERAAQILKNTGYAWRALDHLKNYDAASAAPEFFAACNMENSHD